MTMHANHWAIALGVTLLAAPAAWAADTIDHSGTVTAVNVARSTITIEEMGPWHPGHASVKREVFALTPETRVELARRQDVAAGRFPGQWADQALPAASLRTGDFATVTAERAHGRLEATKVVVVRPGGSDRRAGRAVMHQERPS